MLELLSYPMRTNQGDANREQRSITRTRAALVGWWGGELPACGDDKSIATGTRHFNTSANTRPEKEVGQMSVPESAPCSPYLIFLL